MAASVMMASTFAPLPLPNMQQPLQYDTPYQALTISPSDSLLDKPMALLILQDRLSSSASLSSISSSSGSGSDSSSCSPYNKPLPAITEDVVAPEQDDVPECDYTIAESEPIFEEFEPLAEKPNFRQRIMRIWTKQATESKGYKADNTKPKRHSVPNIHFHSPPPLPPALRETRRSFNHHMNGFKRWRSVLHRNSVPTQEPAIPDTKRAAPVKPQPRPRALSEDNGRLHLHMNDRLDYLQDPIKEGNTPQLRHSRSLSSVNRLKELFGVRVQQEIPARPKKTVQFDPSVCVLPTYGESQYNRTTDRTNTCYCLSTESAFMIRDELNRYKLYEMDIHIKSRYMTHFIP